MKFDHKYDYCNSNKNSGGDSGDYFSTDFAAAASAKTITTSKCTTGSLLTIWMISSTYCEPQQIAHLLRILSLADAEDFNGEHGMSPLA